MALTVKQLEELDLLNNNIEQFDDISDNSLDKEEVDEATAGALACRRQVLERAIEFTNQIKQSHLNTANDYRVGMLVYDSLNKKYARVAESSLEKVHLKYVSGGEAFLIGSSITNIQSNKISDNCLEKRLTGESNLHLLPGKIIATVSNNSHAIEPISLKKNKIKLDRSEVEIKQSSHKLKNKTKISFSKNHNKEEVNGNAFFKSKNSKTKKIISNDLVSRRFSFKRYLNLLYSIFLSSVVFFLNSNSDYIFGLSVFSNQTTYSVYTLFFIPRYIPITSILKSEGNKLLYSGNFAGLNILKGMISCLLKSHSNKKELILYASQIEYLLYVKVKHIKRLRKLNKI